MKETNTKLDRRQLLSCLGAAGVGLLGAQALGGLVQPAYAVPTSQPTTRPAVRPFRSDLATLRKVDPRAVRFRIALIADPHLALRDKSMDFKVLRWSPFIYEQHLSVIRNMHRLTGRKVDLLLIAGDLTRDSEPWNHAYMMKSLRQVGIPSLVIPGNHDVFKAWMKPHHWGIDKFVVAYQGRHGGYQGKAPYYMREVTPGLVIIGLNSSDTPDGKLRKTWNGRVDQAQLTWLKRSLAQVAHKKLVFLMIHHNLLAHHPADLETSKSNWKNFHLDNSHEVLALMGKYNVPIALTGHHHLNHIVKHPTLPIHEICTSGACSYPAQFRILDLDKHGRKLTVHTTGLSWPTLLARVAQAAKADTFWKLPDKPHDLKALLAFLEGQPKDRHTTLPLPPRPALR